MNHENLPIHLYTPHTMNDLFNIIHHDPEVQILNEETRRTIPHAPFQRFVSLSHIHDLQRISRFSNRIDIGIAVPIARIINETTSILPDTIIEALRLETSFGTRPLSTLFSLFHRTNLCAPIIGLFAALHAKIETRTHIRHHPHHTTLTQYINHIRRTVPRPFIYRIRLPILSWNIQCCLTCGDIYDASTYPVSLSGFALKEKNKITAIRIAICVWGPKLLWNQKIEPMLLSHTLPIRLHECQYITKIFYHSAQSEQYHLHETEKRHIAALTQRFCRMVNSYDPLHT